MQDAAFLLYLCLMDKLERVVPSLSSLFPGQRCAKSEEEEEEEDANEI